MVDKPGTGGPGAVGDTDRSVGELVSDVTGNFSRLVRLELELAKAEAKLEAAKAGKGIAGFAVFAVLMHIFVILLSVTIAFVLYEVAGLPGWASFAIVTGFYLLVAIVFALFGLVSFRRMRGLERTRLTTSRLGAILRREITPPGSEVAAAGRAGATATTGN
ncbi:phage holin family protein [Nocardiopsis changdeensis]|uniref:Phage holin family protein n=1 Tax=Nocardiopsis changdeensis TaxID=2831969 RepID=A0ABX8BLF9_9ACTN|nr:MULTISPECIES: phage holin family protein [Nocardiopsis]QKW31696.1 phage holin family protein [Nocardiopsis flavescens]QUX22931.1 phage holin family protein [Nocardiopsis changdeensis]QYX38874.1 phage holin family protein [Nocardiopsis sp. MT53]